MSLDPKNTEKVTVRLYHEDMQYLRRKCPRAKGRSGGYNQYLRELVHWAVEQAQGIEGLSRKEAVLEDIRDEREEAKA